MKELAKFIIYLFILFVFTITFIIVFISNVSTNTFSTSLNPKTKYIAMSIFPESFAFFTKDPKDEQIRFYSFNNNKVEEINLKTNSKSNLYGFSRKSRRLTYELGTIVKRIPDSIWHDITQIELENIQLSDSTPLNLKRDKNILVLDKGKYLLYYYKPIKWEWNNLKKTSDGKYAYFTIE